MSKKSEGKLLVRKYVYLTRKSHWDGDFFYKWVQNKIKITEWYRNIKIKWEKISIYIHIEHEKKKLFKINMGIKKYNHVK